MVVVQLVSRVQLFVTPWTAAHQTSLSFTIFWSLLKLMSMDSVMPSNHLILCRPFSIFPSIRVFSNELAYIVKWNLLQGPQSHSIPTARNNNPGPGEGGGRENIQTLQKSNMAASWSASASRRVSPPKEKQLEKFYCPCHPQHKCTGNLPLR